MGILMSNDSFDALNNAQALYTMNQRDIRFIRED